jgi:hypothetical protein
MSCLRLQSPHLKALVACPSNLRAWPGPSHPELAPGFHAVEQLLKPRGGSFCKAGLFASWLARQSLQLAK